MTRPKKPDKKPEDPRIDIVRENIRIAAAKRGLNHAEISRQAGMSRNGVQQFVTGQTSITHSNLLKVCDVLQVPIGILHRPDAVTDNRIRLYRILDRMPDHLAEQAFVQARDILGPGGQI